jgi:sulfate transport system ATP-binding protein
MSIEVRHVTKTFGNFRALDDVNLKVNDGHLVALLGPSGSGKTTLLRVIAGMETPDPRPDTAILFHDRDVADQHVGQRQGGFVFQHYALFKHLTVLENIAFGLRVRPRSTRPSDAEIRQRARQLLKLVQLEGIERRYPSQLSGGQRQRVALARALAVEPRVLLLDEPFGALDAKVRTELRRWLRRLHDEIRVTSVFVTHDQEEALEVADRVVVMNHGRIEQVGSADEVFHYPANEFVMDFLGNVNLFHCRIEQGKAVFGSLESEVTEGGQTVRMFVRPHDLDILAQADHRPAMRARVVRIQSAGSMVKLELLGDVGGPFYAEIPHDRFKLLCLSPGSVVYASPRDAKVFVEDYQI